jgi:hypothetical protein
VNDVQLLFFHSYPVKLPALTPHLVRDLTEVGDR